MDLTKDNFSFYTIPLTYLLAFAPHLYLEILTLKKVGRWNNVSPRLNIETNAARVTAAELAMFKRAHGAHHNGLEAFPVFAAAVIAANVAGVPVYTLNKWSIIFVLLRVVYNPLYIFGTSATISTIRTLVWFGANFAALNLLKLSGDKALGR